jgi:diaminopimelate epimerase
MKSDAVSVPFVKANACGNDFLIIESQHAPNDIGGFSAAICNRHTGVGADGVEWVKAGGAGADISARLINADGGEAEISGNGTRCVAAYFADDKKVDQVRVGTGAGVKSCKVISRSGRKFEFELNMGVPKLEGQIKLKLSSGQIEGTRISMGNPQFVLFADVFAANWREIGAEIQSQKVFAQGVNVDFVRMKSERQIEVRFFERGVGETQSSGTGSCASAVAAIASGRVKSPVKVSATGGEQEVRWKGNGSEVLLTGPAEIVCRGEFFV